MSFNTILPENISGLIFPRTFSLCFLTYCKTSFITKLTNVTLQYVTSLFQLAAKLKMSH